MSLIEKETLARQQGLSYGQLMQVQDQIQIPPIVKAMVVVKIGEIENDLASDDMPELLIPMARKTLHDLKIFRMRYCGG